MRVSAAIADLFGACCKGEENALFCAPSRRFEPSFSETEPMGGETRFVTCQPSPISDSE